MVSPDIIQRALAQIQKRAANHEYFFSRLSSPDWIAPLKDAGLFNTPPQAVRHGTTISFARWPESEYLARMAQSAPELVLETIAHVPFTDNVRIHADFATAAVRMPGPLAAKWTRAEIEWIKQQDDLYFLLPERLATVLVHLAEAGEIDAAMALARELLSVRLDAQVGEPRARFASWEYEKILKTSFPSLAKTAKGRALELLCDLLQRSLRLTIEVTDANEDYSHFWRPAIDDHVQNAHHGEVRDSLVSAVRDTSTWLLVNGMAASEIIATLTRRDESIFYRIAIHLLTIHFDAAPALAREWACSEKNCRNVSLHREQAKLLRACLPTLDRKSTDRVLAWFTESTSEDAEHRDRWSLQRLSLLEEELPVAWRKKYDQLVARFGPPGEHADFLSYMTMSFGPRSPKEPSELRSMPPAAIAEFLRTWVAPDGWMQETPEGLAQALQSDIATRSSEYLSTLGEFRNVDPTYASAILHGLNDAAKAGQSLNWQPIVDYAQWVVAQPRLMAADNLTRFDRDPHWGWARSSLARLLGTAFDQNVAPSMRHEDLWKIVSILCEDPDPTPENDAKSSMDPVTHSINTTRGQALHAAMRFALWVHRNRTSEGRPADGIDERVKLTLERHLDVGHEVSPAIRAVYGMWLPQLLALERKWVESRYSLLFPQPPTYAALRIAVWEGYIRFCAPYDNALEVLRSEYEAAVLRLREHGDPTEVESQKLDVPLGEHLMLFVARGKLDWGEDGSIVRAFFGRASEETGERTLSFIGRWLLEDEVSPTAAALTRLHALWESVVASAQRDSIPVASTLKAFGWWFASQRFDPTWSVSKLLEVLTIARVVDADFLIVERLAEQSSTEPEIALKILRELTRQESESVLLATSLEHIRTILEAALRAPACSEDARALIHELGAKGYTELRDLVSSGHQS